MYKSIQSWKTSYFVTCEWESYTVSQLNDIKTDAIGHKIMRILIKVTVLYITDNIILN